MGKEIVPKEKAKELVDKIFAEIASAYSGYYETAKGIAVIMVEEIQKTETLEDRYCGYLPIEKNHKEYWEQVKAEIIKLEYGN